METDQLPQLSSEGPPHIHKYPRRGGEPGESRMPYSDLLNVTSSESCPPATVYLMRPMSSLKYALLNMLFDLVPRPYFGATLGLAFQPQRQHHIHPEARPRFSPSCLRAAYIQWTLCKRASAQVVCHVIRWNGDRLKLYQGS